ncbi:hypothetical protein [Paenibacillus polymyxa]|uniref:hypothetical protein n=1 Tax=Paenibacillus polymyxa TaxID=1406 RepID=UPI001EF9D6FF|nr:hypothetical protein [Paenibacillus polymyxa]
MTDQQLNRALAELMGWRNFKEDEHNVWGAPPDDGWSNSLPRYCTDPAASLEVQAKAIELDRVAYVNNLYEACYEFKRDKDSAWDEINIAFLLNASPRQRTEAAYLTLSNRD